MRVFVGRSVLPAKFVEDDDIMPGHCCSGAGHNCQSDRWFQGCGSTCTHQGRPSTLSHWRRGGLGHRRWGGDAGV